MRAMPEVVSMSRCRETRDIRDRQSSQSDGSPSRLRRRVSGRVLSPRWLTGKPMLTTMTVDSFDVGHEQPGGSVGA